MSGIVGWIVGKLKWLLLIAALGGPFVAYSSWEDGQRRREVEAKGIQATANIDGATRVKRRRGGTTYKVNLSWTDAAGKPRSASDVTISHELANRIIVNDTLQVPSLAIKYMAERVAEAGAGAGDKENVIVAEDEAHQVQSDDEMIYVGIGAGIVGAIGSALMFLLGRRRRTEAQPA